jgi:pimeloyl-ACP methyl ester carboxylesterase
MPKTVDPDIQLKHLTLAADRAGVDVAEFVVPEDHHMLAGDIRLHYLDWGGPAGARPILLLHGGALTAHTWDIVALGLRDRFHCIALDQRGHGDSEWSPEMDYTTAAHVRDIEHVVEQLELDDFLLVGMSMGGLNSIEYAGRHSHRLKGLVIVDVGPELRFQGTDRIRDFVSRPAEFDSIEGFVEQAVSFNSQRSPELLRLSLLHNLRQLPDGKWTWKYDRRHHGRMDMEENTRQRLQLAERLPQISCPTLVVRGAKSDVFWDEDAEKVVSQLHDGRWVKIEGAGHTVQGDNPRDLMGAMLEFFDEIGA